MCYWLIVKTYSPVKWLVSQTWTTNMLNKEFFANFAKSNVPKQQRILLPRHFASKITRLPLPYILSVISQHVHQKLFRAFGDSHSQLSYIFNLNFKKESTRFWTTYISHLTISVSLTDPRLSRVFCMPTFNLSSVTYGLC